MSKPCFELWLFLHVGDDVSGLARGDDCCARFSAAVGGWSKTAAMPEAIDAASVKAAIARAEALDTGTTDAWPQSIGTHVYKLVRRLLEIAPGR